MPNKFAKRVDNNHTQITKELRECRYNVYSTHFVGHGFPDLIVNKSGKNYLVEIKKDEKAELTESEITFNSAFFVIVGHSIETILLDILIYDYFIGLAK